MVLHAWLGPCRFAWHRCCRSCCLCCISSSACAHALAVALKSKILLRSATGGVRGGHGRRQSVAQSQWLPACGECFIPHAYPASAKEGAAISRLATAAVATGLIRSTLDTSCAHQAASNPSCSVAAWCMACWRDCDEGKCWAPSLARSRLQMPLQAALLQMLLQCRPRLQLLRVREPHLLLGLYHHHPRGGAGGRSPDGREGALVAAHKGRHLAAAVKWRGARVELGGAPIRSPTATLVSLACTLCDGATSNMIAHVLLLPSSVFAFTPTQHRSPNVFDNNIPQLT